MRCSQSGLTLVELMIVVLLIGLLALMASPLTGNWVNGARVGESLAAMEQAVGQAKAAALRNPAAIQGTDAASAICLSTDGVLSVRPAKPAAPPNAAEAATCDAGGPAPLWSTRLPANVTVKIGTAAWSCSCFTNRALLTTLGTACGSCGNSLAFTISAGTENDTHEFH
jgi:prepilin-type N-terminal cleavage/methylation domain-containing protein